MPHWKYWNVESRIGSSRSSTRTLNLRGLLNHADATAACLPSRTERNQAPKAKSKHDETTHTSSSSQIELLIAKPMPAKCKAIFKIWIQHITMWFAYIIIIHQISTWLHAVLSICSIYIAAWCMTSPNDRKGFARHGAWLEKWSRHVKTIRVLLQWLQWTPCLHSRPSNTMPSICDYFA